MEAGFQKLEKTMAVLCVDHLWSTDEVDAQVAAIRGGWKDKAEASKQLWQCWRLWVKRAKLKFPVQKLPLRLVVDVIGNWMEGLKGLLERPAVKAAAQVRHMATQFNCTGHSLIP